MMKIVNESLYPDLLPSESTSKEKDQPLSTIGIAFGAGAAENSYPPTSELFNAA